MRFFILSLPLFLHTGCQMNKQSSSPTPEKEIVIRHVPEEVEKTDLFVEGEWPKQEWWSVFQDHQLSLFITKALSENPSLAAIESRVSEASKLSYVARAKLFPHLHAILEAIWGRFSGFTGHFYPDNAGVRLGYGFEL